VEFITLYFQNKIHVWIFCLSESKVTILRTLYTRISSQNESVDPVKEVIFFALPPRNECNGMAAGCSTMGTGVLWLLALVLRTRTVRDETAMCIKQRTNDSQFKFVYAPILITFRPSND
jgi:hypothetical protein